MSKQLAGTMFVRNGDQYDYCYMEAIESLLNFCDAVYVCDAGSDDGTLEKLKSITNPKFVLIERTKEEWESQKGKGKEKLCYFTDIAIEKAQNDGYEYSFYCQADEVVHERSYSSIREACKTGEEAFMITRINLWRTPYYQLNVPQNRLPCSTYIIRLTKTNYRSIGDAESIAVPYCSHQFVNSIRMYHMGFVRRRDIMKSKVINMQEVVFELGNHDNKLDGSDIFNPDLWFDPIHDLKLIDEPLPNVIKQWAENRN